MRTAILPWNSTDVGVGIFRRVGRSPAIIGNTVLENETGSGAEVMVVESGGHAFPSIPPPRCMIFFSNSRIPRNFESVSDSLEREVDSSLYPRPNKTKTAALEP